LSIKDEVEFVKGSLSGDEKILESAFKVERIYKKHKLKLWAGIAVVVLLIGANFGTKAYKEGKLNTANEALLTLKADPKNSEAMEQLKANNPKLYELYSYAEATKSGDVKALKELSSSGDALIADISKYHAAALESKSVNSEYYQDLVLVQEAYSALKDNKKDVANQKLTLIAENSPVSSIARLLRHYTIESK